MVEVYALRRPSYKEMMEFKDADGIRERKDSGTTIDEEKLALVVLPQCVEGMTTAEVEQLTDARFIPLYNKLRDALNPDPMSIPFS